MRDNRDPEILGQWLLEQHALTPDWSFHEVADYATEENGFTFRNYGESEQDFGRRLAPLNGGSTSGSLPELR